MVQIDVASGIPPLIAVGGSREGLSALIDLVAGLPRWLSASVVACLDTPELTGASLISALRANTDWRVQWVQGGNRVMRRHVHGVMPGRVAIVDRHGNFRTLPQSAPAQPRVGAMSWFRVRPAARAIPRPGPAGAGRRPGAEGD